MKKKLLPLVLASSLALGATFTLASCGGNKGPAASDLLKNIILEDNKEIKDDFKVTATVKNGEDSYNILWSSDNALLKVSDEAYEGSYTVTVARPDDAKTTVHLTASLDINGDKAEKQFTFFISPLDVYDFSGKFVFAQEGAVVSEDFDLPTEFKIGDKTAEITWAPVNTNLITIDETAHKAKVTCVAPAEKAKVRATFKYAGKETKVTYALTVYRKLTAMESLKYWYEHTGIAQTMSGYVVAKDKYDTGYGNAAYYIVDDSLQGGYYAYRMKSDQATYDSITVGTHITITGATNTSYKGLVETSGNVGKITVDKDIAKKTKAELVQAIDQDLIANVDSLYYRSSSLVSLTGWKVKAITDDAKDESKYGQAATLLTLTKGGVDIKVMSSKYVQVDKADTTSLVNTMKELKVNDLVDVVGVLSYNNADNKGYDQASYQISVTDADSVKKNTTWDATQDEALANNAKAVAKAIAATSVENIYQTKDVALPTTVEGCTVSWAFSTPADVYTPRTVTIENNTLKATPDAKVEEVVLVATFTKGDYSAKQFYTINTIAKTDQELVDDEIKNFKLDITTPGTYDLVAKGELYNVVNLTYTIKSQKNKAGEDVTIAEVKDGKLVIDAIDPNDTHTIVVEVTYSKGEITQKKEYTLTVNNPDFVYNKVIKSIDESKTYKIGFYQSSLGEEYYLTGAEDGNYLETTNDYTKAAEVHVKANTNGTYYLYVESEGTKSYLCLEASTSKLAANAQLSETPFEWKWNSTYNTFVAEITYNTEKSDFYMGTYGSFKTMSASKISYAGTSMVSHLLEVEKDNYSRQQKVNIEKSVFEYAAAQKASDTYVLPSASVFGDVTITAEKDSSDTTSTKVSGNEITFGLVESETQVKVKVIFECNGKTAEDVITFTVTPLEFTTITDLINATKGDNPTVIKDKTTIYTYGVVKSINTTNSDSTKHYAWITDGTSDFEVYGNLAETGLQYSDFAVGDVIYVTGLYTLYGTTHETSKGTAKVYEKREATVDEKLLVTAAELTLPATYEEDTTVQLQTVGKIFSDINVSWAAKQPYTTASVSVENVLTITQGSADEDVTLVATVEKTGVNLTQREISFKVKAKNESPTKDINMHGTESINNSTLVEGTDYADKLNLDTEIFDVKFAKNGSSFAGAINTSYITTYYMSDGNGSGFTISVKEGYTIDKLVINYDVNSKLNGVITVAGTALSAVTADHTTDTVTLAANTTSVVIKNTGTTNQVRIASIDITYTKTA